MPRTNRRGNLGRKLQIARRRKPQSRSRRRSIGRTREMMLPKSLLAMTNLTRLNISGELLKKAAGLEVHSMILDEAEMEAKKTRKVDARKAREILETALRELPGNIGRNRGKWDELQLACVREIEKRFGAELEQLKGMPDKPIDFPEGFIMSAKTIHLDEIRHLLGEEKYAKYMEIRGERK